MNQKSPKKEEGILSLIRRTDFSLDRIAAAFPELDRLKGVPQNPLYHGEGDVWQHTQLVCRKVTELDQWQSLTDREQELLFLAAAFHDIGKPACTRLEDGNWTSPRHTIVGEKVFWAMAYRQQARFGLTREERELTAKLIRRHGLPVWFLKKQKPEAELIKTAECVPLKLLYLLSKADVAGRYNQASEDLESSVELFGEYGRELGIWEHPYPFADPYTRYEYFHRDDLWEGSRLYDETTFDVCLMAGLPLAGKDTWIEGHKKGLPVISLDQIREEYGISPQKGALKVVQIATKRAREHLRRQEPFIWNATNLIFKNREQLCSLFRAYHARIHLVYLEAPYEEILIRNRKRQRSLPLPVLERMIDHMEMPEPWETHFQYHFPNRQL